MGILRINLYALPHIIKVIKTRRNIWPGHVARTVQARKLYKILVRNPEVNRP